jgi:outer membrane receptor protein involved in Fe transport
MPARSTKTWSRLFRAIANLALLGFLACPLHGGTTGKIAGKVTDAQTKEALIGANAVVVGTTLGAASDVDGNYFIINIPPGTVSLRISAVGYAPTTVSDIKVVVDQTTRINVELQPQAITTQVVEVTATRPIVQKDMTSTTSTVSSEQLKTLPVETVTDAVNLQAGVVEGHFRGGRSNEVKYLVDGVSVNDVFSGEKTLEPEINSVQEVQVLSGTFNAEYGEALSGVVNQVTKIAGDDIKADFSGYLGDYASSRADLYPYIDHISPLNITNFEGSVSGPVPGTDNAVKFFVSGRTYYNDGYLYAQRIFVPSDSSYYPANDPQHLHVQATGDSAYVPMNSDKRISLQSKLSFRIGGTDNLALNALYQKSDTRQYNHDYLLNPDGDWKYFQASFLGTATLNHVFNDRAFLDVMGSAFISDYKQYAFENSRDAAGNIIANPDYVSTVLARAPGANTFLTGGSENWNFYHHTDTYTGKIDLTDQVSTVHLLKGGIDVKYNTLRYEDYQIHVDPPSYIPSLPPPGAFDQTYYKNHPYQLAAYLQDKIELDYMVVNLGLRYDYFQPDGQVLKDPDNIQQLDTLSPPYPAELFYKASAKSQLSPRIGVSYPITDKGAVHLSYGHFFQIPPFQYLYTNPNFRIPGSTAGFPASYGRIIGNTDLNPQQTIMYELGLQQELLPDLGITVTGFYKDIRNLLGLELHYKGNFQQFWKYVNVDYGAVRGFTFSLDKRMGGGYEVTADYTYQVAQGNASDPLANYNKAQATPPIPVNKQLVPLDWDRRHSLNLTFSLGRPQSYLSSIIVRMGSGLPYTPTSANANAVQLENSDNKPAFFNADFIFTKYLTVAAVPLSLFVKVYNLFDTPNEDTVYPSTGRAGSTLDETRPGTPPPVGVNTLAEYFSRPDFYSAPRQIIVGTSVSF